MDRTTQNDGRARRLTPHRRFALRPVHGLAVAAIAIGIVAGGCDQPRTSARPSASLLEIDVSHPPSAAATEQSTEPTQAATFVSIPVGWDNSFCSVLADAVVAQELVIDIERALNEDPPAVKDARQLTHELRDITAEATTLITQVPAWDTGADAIQRLGVMADLGSKAAEQYETAFDQQSANALRKARGFRRDIGRETQATNDAVANIANSGIACEGTSMQLETF